MLRKALLTPRFENFQVVCVRHKQVKLPKVDKKFQAEAESLAARGFLRPNKPWDPPVDINTTILKICSENGLNEQSTFDSLEIKYSVLKACFDQTGHSVPNSLLHTIENVDDLQTFYETPVDTLTPFDSLKKMDLPRNLHVQEDYVRFHPDKDTLFNGKTVFPKRSSIVSGLKARKKYEGFTAKRSWP
ncbi:hypothetical protein KGM_209594 [Danaus plexippus plexippus]|uniref:Large ribosomal subunit protein mL50 n=1 Tax=Danaus plexippus plexippus TaxID=278856 RepID=A0A212FFI3_DANPL|nr:hypothetical protein KGM_209594 [Danaus plexippus plexippus]